MSAIAGIWNFDGRPGAAQSCARMLGAQQMYGPDAPRQWSDRALALGRRLFRTLPEDAYDPQPLQSRDGRLVLVADVRLDNRRDLCSELDLNAVTADRLCDAAILLESLLRWGEAALDRIVGDFAFALWDSSAEKLILARDFAGQRPLHYHCGKGFFAFATMPKGLHAHPDIPYSPDEQAVAEFTAMLPEDGTRSFFAEIAPVRSGHVVTVDRNGVTSRLYWRPSPPSDPWGRGGDAVEGLRHHLDEATRSRLRGARGGTAGAHLSAGFDSSAVTATAARLLAPQGGRVVAFTAVPREGYDGPCPPQRLGDEGPLAAATAALYPNVEHVLVRSGSRSPLDEIDRNFLLFDRPTLNLCNLTWIAAINAAARERGINVLLTGQLGNFSLSYNGVQFLPDLARAGRLVRLARESVSLVRHGGMPWRSAVAQVVGPFLPAPVWRAIRRLAGRELDVRRYTAISARRLAELDFPELASRRGLDPAYRPRANAFETRLWAIGRADNGTMNKGMLAGWGIDLRDPTADRRLVEFCLALPLSAYISGGETRALARRALADRLPAVVMAERRKGYQAVDWHEGMAAARDQISAELGRLSSCAAAARTLDLERMQKLVEQWPLDGWAMDDAIEEYRLALYRGISAGHFLRKAVGSNA